MKLSGLPLFHRVAGGRIVVVGEGAAADARRRLVARAGAHCVGEAEAHQAALAFVAIEDRQAAQVVALRLRRRGLLVNVTDRPELCDFTVPSILEREPVVIAVGTGGVSAGLAKMLRVRLEALLPEGLGRLARALNAARDTLRGLHPDAGERRRALDAALAQGGPLDPLAEHDANAVDRWLARAGDEPGASLREIVLRSDDPDDLTLRELRWLATADRLLVGPGVPSRILDRARADAERASLGTGTATDGAAVIVRLPGGPAA